MSQPLTIAIETCFLFDQYSRRGIGRYAREIYKRLLQEEKIGDRPLHILWIGYKSLDKNITELFDGQAPELPVKIEFISLGRKKLSRPITNIWQYYTQIRPIIKTHKPDLYFATYFERGLPSELVPTIVTAHDAIPLRTGRFTARGLVTNWFKGKYYRHMWNKQKKAVMIFTDSNTAAKELVDFGGLDSEKIEPIYLGISDIFTKAETDLGNWKTNLPFDPELTDYIIYDAGFEENKQVPKLFEQFKYLVNKYPELKLVITGREFAPDINILESRPNSKRARKLVTLAENLGIASNIIPVSQVSEASLVGLLKNAKAYINFSAYEGFGFGPLQAMRAGTPAIISDNECFQEVSAGGALIVDPNNPAINTDRIIELITNKELHQTQIKKGLQHTQNFTWYNTWQSTKALLERLCASLT